MVIIGVVAAMTMPVIIANKQSEELRTSLKKNYSLTQQVFLQMSTDMGQTVTNSTLDFFPFKQSMIKYYSVIKDCDYSITDTFNINTCLTYLNPQMNSVNGYYYTLNSKTANLGYFNNGSYMLVNGVVYMIFNQNKNGTDLPVYITIDVNGANKKPNRWGYDVFTFQLMHDGKLLPMGMTGTDFTDEEQFCSKNSSNIYNGIACTSKALNEKDYWRGIK